ncbi:MAG: DUF4244 domain-containing protein [Motilibacteraceae bacterium]
MTSSPATLVPSDPAACVTRPVPSGAVPARRDVTARVAVPQPAQGGRAVRAERRTSGAVRQLRRSCEAGMSTAEYAVGMLAACGFAGLLLKVLTSSTVSGLLTGLVKRALTLVG